MSNNSSSVPEKTVDEEQSESQKHRNSSNSNSNSNCSINTPPSISSTHTYPKPEADFQLIAQNPHIFLLKLQAFHAAFRTKFKIPTIGGKPLDLHRLFVEVTSRGGIEKIIRDRRWKEVTGAFKFPSSITSASFVLRKYYLSLLYHFEQVYYFRKEEPSLSVPDSTNKTIDGLATRAPEDGGMFSQYSDSLDLEDGSLVTGTIDAKFDYGYLITVNLGSEKLSGVLYHTPAQPNMSQTPKVPSSLINGRKRRKKRFKDPSRPKRNSSGYNFFFAEHYARLKSSYQGQEKSISKKIGVLWSRLSDSEKQVYQERGLRDKERYKIEMLEYKSSHH